MVIPNNTVNLQDAGKAVPSIALNLIRQLQGNNLEGELTPEQDTIARDVTGVAYAGQLEFLLDLNIVAD